VGHGSRVVAHAQFEHGGPRAGAGEVGPGPVVIY